MLREIQEYIMVKISLIRTLGKQAVTLPYLSRHYYFSRFPITIHMRSIKGRLANIDQRHGNPSSRITIDDTMRGT
jgi:hypothetical protein